MQKIFLGIDFGTKRIGLAIASTPLAEPMSIISSNENTLEKLQDICQKYQITHLVVGLSEGNMAEKSKGFGEKLSNLTNLPVYFHDETLSSFETHQNLATQKAKKTKKRSPIDHLAAAAILQEYISDHKSFK